MRAYDALPPALRRWLSNAALPWSPDSCRRIWRDARDRGESEADLIARLNRAEQKSLARDRFSCAAQASAATARKTSPETRRKEWA